MGNVICDRGLPKHSPPELPGFLGLITHALPGLDKIINGSFHNPANHEIVIPNGGLRVLSTLLLAKDQIPLPERDV